MSRFDDCCAAIDKLRKKYPECYIEMWGPEDFEGETDKELTHDDHCAIVDWLYHRHDCEYGTTWKSVRQAIQNVVEHYED